MDIPLLTYTVSSATALFNLHGIPRKIVVDDDIRELQVQTFTTGIRRNENVCLITEVLESDISLVYTHASV